MQPIIVIMGVMASGKTTVSRALADALGWTFQEGDELHTPENRRKLSAGLPLTDIDRRPWLAAIAHWMDERIATNQPGIVACSALRRIYRDQLRRGRPQVHFVVLAGDAAILRQRLAQRHGHFAAPELLQSQLDTLEMPGLDEHALVLPLDWTVAEQCAAVIRWLQGPRAEPARPPS